MGSHEAKTTSFSTEEEENDNSSYAMQLLFSGALPMVLNTVIKLNVFEIIAREGPNAQLSPFQIVSQMPNNKNSQAPEMLDRMLRMLASYSIFTCSVVDSNKRVYGLGTVYELGAAVLDGGIPFERAHRMPIYKYAGLDQKFNETFNVSMLHQTKMVVANIIENYKGFENLKTLVDVGGGAGVALSVITSKFPNIKGINYDLPHVIEHAPKYPGVEHIGGDMFVSVPEGDAIFMKTVLHNWDDDHCLRLLKNCYKALPESGNLIVVDAIIPMNPDNSSSTKHIAQVDMFMLLNQQPGAKERTEQEFFTLATKAGFKRIQRKCVFFDLWVMEFNK
ncbi:hypothetical protein M9H77_14579 [Catharanthus roseus]|uniref:Uncharacterized protein n=2 Tax=Catharanthus roseus TaxID=4058 RepID=A0ACC0BNQ3_CATRO|nr:hypothetical protein M9H77_14578 [Catharanthus roseus]KAI5674215.1 hypothetical protein M9H77_14579 [Catharanthus roseus]